MRDVEGFGVDQGRQGAALPGADRLALAPALVGRGACGSPGPVEGVGGQACRFEDVAGPGVACLLLGEEGRPGLELSAGGFDAAIVLLPLSVLSTSGGSC